jgi:hypothetical protein
VGLRGGAHYRSAKRSGMSVDLPDPAIGPQNKPKPKLVNRGSDTSRRSSEVAFERPQREHSPVGVARLPTKRRLGVASLARGLPQHAFTRRSAEGARAHC